MVPNWFHNWLTELDHDEFEEVIGDIFDRKGWNTTRTQSTCDNGYDVHLERPNQERLVEVKQNRVGPRSVDNAVGVAVRHDVPETAVAAISFTSGGVEAAETTERNSDITIEVYDQECLYNDIVSVGLRDFVDEHSSG